MKVKAGRPSKEYAQQRRIALLKCAFHEFLENGFAATTIDAIAEKMQMTKRTIYNQYASKEKLFQACVELAMLDTKITDDQYESAVTDDIATTLFNIAKLRIDMYQGSSALGLQKILSAESGRFPHLVALNYRHDPAKARSTVQTNLERFAAEGHIQCSNGYVLAEMFLGMSVGLTVSLLKTGHIDNTAEAIDRQIESAVSVFLSGIKN